MESLKFAKMDFMKMKSQGKLMLLFVAIAAFLSIKMDTPIWGLLYIVFGAMIMSSIPAFSDTVSENGFIRLLPAHAESRIYGRYLFEVIYIFASSIIGLLVAAGYIIINHEIPDYILEIFIAVLGAALFMNAIQFLILSLMTTKNPQILSIVRMVIPFVMFFGGSAVLGNLSEGSAESFGMMENVVKYAMSHLTITSLFVLLVALLMTLLCALISAKHEAHKEK